MEWLVNNWSLVVTTLVVIGYFVLSGTKSLSNWLLMAVTLAERDLSSGTGRLKLVQVYTDFVSAYPILSKIIPFAVFSAMVDSALEEMRHLIRTNSNIKKFVEGEQ